MYRTVSIGICFIKVILLMIFTIFVMEIGIPKCEASGGIAISGSFYRQHFRMVPGENFESPDVYVVVFNNYDTDAEIKFKTDVPQGVKIDIGESGVKISAKSNVKLPVKLNVGENVVPGTYIISIAAEIKPSINSGISVVSSTQLRSTLTVFGEAGLVKINTITAEGKPFAGKINLFYNEGNNALPAAFSQTGELTERIIPGNYVAKAFWGNTEIAANAFDLNADEKKDIMLKVSTVFIEGFTINSQDANGKDNMSSAGITYNIKNIYNQFKDVKLNLKVYYAKTKEDFVKGSNESKSEDMYKDNLLEEIEMLQLPTLEVGSQSGRGTYIPAKGWKNGVYKFKLVLYGKSSDSEDIGVQATSQDLEVNVQRGSNFKSYAVVICSFVVLFAAIWFVVSKRRSSGDISQ